MGLVLACMSLLCFGAVIAPGVGVSGYVMLQTPSVVLEWAHAPGYGLLAWLLIRCLQRRGWPLAYAVAVGCTAAMVFGLWTEVLQGMVPGRQTDAGDLMIDAIGIVISGILSSIRKFREQQDSFHQVPADEFVVRGVGLR